MESIAQAQTQANTRYALLTSTLASFFTPFMGSSINLAIPAIGAEFQAGALSLNWVVSAFLLTSAAFLLPFGRLADLYGRKKVFLAGVAGYAVFSALSAAASSLGMLIIMRALQGISSAMIFSTAVAILISVFPPSERGRVLGFNAAAVYAGLSSGPFLGGFITH
ncbi:MAG: MFS transporter, partial [Moorellaceae bacterium]